MDLKKIPEKPISFFYGFIIALLFAGCLSRGAYYTRTVEYSSDILYKNNASVYKCFANHSLSGEFTPIISRFYIKDVDYLNKIIQERNIIKISSKEELMELQEIIYFDNIIENIDDDIFIDNALGMIVITFTGLEYLKNEKIMNIDNNMTFSVEIWDRKADFIPALLNLAVYFIKIPVSEEVIIEPLKMEINVNDEIWLNGEMLVFNGWPPNVRMIVDDNKIIGIDDNSIPDELVENIWNITKGAYNLKFIYVTDMPYYDDPILVFKIIEFNNIEVEEPGPLDAWSHNRKLW